MITSSERRRFGVWLAAVIVVVGFSACLAANYPGHFTPDSVWQLAQGREGRFNDWHPPVMAWLLGVADHIVPGAGPFMTFDAVLFYCGLLAFAALEPRPRPAGLAILALWMVSPLALVFQGAVLKDVLFADFALAGFAALAWAGRCWNRRFLRWALLVLASGFLTITALTRQNGLIVPIFAALALAAMVYTRGPRTSRMSTRLARSAVAAGAGLALVMVFASVATLALRTYGDGRHEGRHHLNILQVWDLAGAAGRDSRLELPALHVRAPKVEAFVRRSAAPAYRSAGADNIVTLPGGALLTNPPGPSLGEDWLRLVVARPGLYLNLRAKVWLDTLLTPTTANCPMVFVGVDGGGRQALLRRAGLATRDDDRDDWDWDYAAAFFGTPLFSHAAYGLTILGILGVSIWRWRRGARDPGLIVGAAMGLAGVAFAASFFVVSVDCDYRFLYFLDVAAMALAVSAACARGPP